MNTYSEFVDIISDKIIITFPIGFYKGRALLEITPLTETTETFSVESRRENFKKLLLKRPSCLTKDEVENFKSISKWMSVWNPTEY